MIKNYKQFNEHIDIDPYGEEDWDENKPFYKWLEINYRYRNMWNKIEIIDCSGNQLNNLEGIENLTKLNYLNCSNNQLTSLEGIENLINLKELWCCYNQLTSLEGIENLKNLKELKCWNNNFSDDYKEYLRKYCKEKKIISLL